MASIINASNSGFGGIVSTGDSSGQLQLQTAGTTAVTIDTSQNVGIGTTTTTPTNGRALIIYETTYPRLTLRNSTTGQTSTDGYGLVGVGNDLYVENAEAGNLAFTTSNTERMRIDSSGRVTTPYQPAFAVYDLTFPSNTTGVGTGGTVVSNVGSYYNSANGRFTAPVSGTYVFNLSVQAFNSGSTTYVNTSLKVNGGSTYGSFVTGYGGTYNNHTQVTGSVILYLTANDYAQIYVDYGARSGAQSTFNGFLIG